MTWQFTLSGFLIGALVGLTGMGGGSLLTPILVIFFGFKPTLAVGTDVLHGAIFKSFGAVRHRRLGTVHAHRLRHTAATAMLRAGSTLSEVGQVLRHRSPLTTAVYAKVDRDALAVLVRPWPTHTAGGMS